MKLIQNETNLNIFASGRLQAPPIVTGQVLVLFTIALAAMEASVGLAIIMLVSRLNVDIDLRKLDRLKGYSNTDFSSNRCDSSSSNRRPSCLLVLPPSKRESRLCRVTSVPRTYCR